MKGSKILLVDDEVIFTDNMILLLTSRGYRVTAVNNGESAIKCLEKEKFDVVVLDLKMPGMDGISTLKEIKKLGLFTETLMLTGHGSNIASPIPNLPRMRRNCAALRPSSRPRTSPGMPRIRHRPPAPRR